MMKFGALSVVLLTATAASAQVTSIESPTAHKKPVAGDPNRIICEKVERLGSRLTADKVCLTAAQWADHKDGHRHDLEKVQQLVNQEPTR
jgi:hypothetical protein